MMVLHETGSCAYGEVQACSRLAGTSFLQKERLRIFTPIKIGDTAGTDPLAIVGLYGPLQPQGILFRAPKPSGFFDVLNF